MPQDLEALRPHAERYAPVLARAALARGLATLAADGTTHPIPITATPVVVDEPEIARRGRLAARLLEAGFKMAQAVVRGPEREWLLASLGPLERGIVERSAPGLRRLALARVDLFVNERPWALELNATIPALPGYSELSAHVFIDVVGAYAGLGPAQLEALRRRNRSNTAALHQSLLQGYADERPGRRPERIALLCRRKDSQIPELTHLAKRFAELGTEAEIIHPDEISGTDALEARGRRFDLVYRHLFVRRLEQISSPWLEAFFAEQPNPRAVCLNGPAAHVETKANFALLSRAVHEPGLAALGGLDAAELEAIAESVPWTRMLVPGRGVDPDGREAPDLPDRVAAEPDRFVLKRAWDYGGKAVFVGRARSSEGFAERARSAYGGELRWEELVSRAARDPAGGGFVVQEVVNTPVQHHWLATPDGLVASDMFVDYSAFGSVHVDPTPPWTGAVRASPSQIVNIAGGGGVLPLLSTEVWRELQGALGRL